MTYKEKVIKDYGIDPTHLSCPCLIFNNGYGCFDDNNDNLSCEDCWEYEYNNETYAVIILKSENKIGWVKNNEKN